MVLKKFDNENFQGLKKRFLQSIAKKKVAKKQPLWAILDSNQ